MRVLVLLAVLGCSLAEGRLVSKCELRDQLMKAIGELEWPKQKGLTVENLVAKIVCHVELAAGFNTSAVNQLTPWVGDHDDHRRGRRETYEGFFSAGELGDPSVTIRPHTREPPSPTRPPRLDEEVWMLYGLFQLSNHLVCSDGTTPSPNICGIECNNLVDDDTRDDISCLLRIISNLLENGFGAAHFKELRRMIRLIFQEECRDKQASEYFAEC